MLEILKNKGFPIKFDKNSINYSSIDNTENEEITSIREPNYQKFFIPKKYLKEHSFHEYKFIRNLNKRIIYSFWDWEKNIGEKQILLYPRLIL